MTRRQKFILVQVLTYVRLPVMNLWDIIILACLGLRRTVPPVWFWVTLVLMIVAALTDLFDGRLARRYQVTSRLGSYGDPFMDHVYWACTLPVLVGLAFLRQQIGHGLLLIALTVLYLQRDHLTTNLRAIGSLHQLDVRAKGPGKYRAAFSFPMICIIYSYFCAPRTAIINHFPFWFVCLLEVAAIGLTLWSGGHYFRKYLPTLKREINRTEV